MPTEAVSHRSLRPHAIGMIGVLVVQYLLGMFSAVYVSFPRGEKERQLWQFAWQQIPVVLHIIVGLLLFVGTMALLVRAALEKDRQWIIAGTIAAASVFLAVIGGAIFIPTQGSSYSFIMAASFIIALLAYFWGLYVSK